MAAGSALPVVKSDEGREAAESRIARARMGREEKQRQREAVERAAFVSRCQQSLNTWWCNTDADGCPDCTAQFSSQVKLRKHVAHGKHMEGAIRP